MKVKELIAKLQELDQDAEVLVPVQTYTQVYPAGYFKLQEVTGSPWEGEIRLWVHLPEGFIISERKPKHN